MPAQTPSPTKLAVVTAIFFVLENTFISFLGLIRSIG